MASRRWHFTVLGEEHFFARHGGPGGGGDAGGGMDDVAPVPEALRRLDLLLLAGAGRQAGKLRRVAIELLNDSGYSRVDLAAASTAELEAMLRKAVQMGIVRLLRSRPRKEQPGPGPGPGPEPPKPPKPVPPKPAPASDKWIEIRLVEDGTGNPIPGVGLSLKLPGAPQPSAFTTDDDGSASAGKLPAGTAAIEGLEDDDGIWELVSISAG